MEAFDRALPAESAPYAQPGAGNVLLTVYYFGEEIGTCDNFTTITSILSAEDTRVNIHDIKKSIAYFLRQSSVDKEAIKTGPVRIDITTVSPLFMPPESVDESSYSTPGHAHHDLPGRHSHLPRSMLAVIASEKHVVEMLSNIERMNVVVGREPGALNTLENWCMQDSKCLRDDFFMAPATNSSPTSLAGTSTGWKGPKIDIILAGGNNMPVPRPRVAIAKTSTSSDMNDRPFTMYQMSVKQAGLEWNIAHRYSDFVALHTALVEQSPTDVGFIPRSRLPELPRKEIGPSNSVDESVVKKRTVGLQSFVRSLLSNPNALSNIHVLSFFGILSTSRHNHLEKLGSRNTIHLSKLKTDCRWGDLILFKCANSMSKLQRSVTGAEWDHVGIVVRGSNMSSNSLELLEATGEGVTSYPLFSRLRAYSDTKFAEYMCLRRLDVGRDIELFQKLHRFTARVVGKPYGFTFSKLISARSLRSSATTNLSDAPSASFPRTHSESDLGAVIQARSPSYLPASNGNLIDRSKSTQKRLTQDMSAACGEPSSDIRASTATNRSSYSDLPSSGKGRRQSIPPKQGISTTDKVMKFFQEHRICKGESKRGSDDVTSELTGTAEEESVPPKLPDEDLSSFFCSELVAACLQIMDLLPKNINVSAIWPGSYTSDGDVDKMMLSGAAYGEEYVIDCRVLEIGRARARESWSSKHTIIDMDDLV